jgi:hypothetical protein
MKVQNLGLITESDAVTFTELRKAAAAIEKQVQSDLALFWGVTGSVTAFADRESVKSGYLVVSVVDHLDGPGLGSHFQPDKGLAFAEVGAGTSWRIALSHECLELLTDPKGTLMAPGRSPDENDLGAAVDLLVEICDPVQDGYYGYEVDGILLSDFCTPAYYNMRIPGTLEVPGRLTFMNRLNELNQVGLDGYLTWCDKHENWYQKRTRAGEQVFVSLGKIDPSDGVYSYREWVDQRSDSVKLKLCGERLVPKARRRKVRAR